MQLYEVSFQAHYEDLIDVGKVAICASDKDDAAERVRMLFELPGSRTVFTTIRLKGNMLQLERREIVKNKTARSINKERSPTAIFLMSAASSIRAASEAHAWRKFAHAILDRCQSDKASIDRSIMEFEMSADRKDHQPRISATEKQAIYTEKQFFAGGMARPR